jgi:hypothetical protein
VPKQKASKPAKKKPEIPWPTNEEIERRLKNPLISKEEAFELTSYAFCRMFDEYFEKKKSPDGPHHVPGGPTRDLFKRGADRWFEVKNDQAFLRKMRIKA